MGSDGTFSVTLTFDGVVHGERHALADRADGDADAHTDGHADGDQHG